MCAIFYHSFQNDVVRPRVLCCAAFVVVEEEPALSGIDEIFLVMTVTVLLSVYAHGLSAAPLTRRYARLTDTLGSDQAEHETVRTLPVRRRREGAAHQPVEAD